MSACARCGNAKLTERPCSECGSWDNEKIAPDQETRLRDWRHGSVGNFEGADLFRRLRTLRATHKNVSWGAIAEELADELVRAVEALEEIERVVPMRNDDEADSYDGTANPVILGIARDALAALSAADTEPGGET